MTKNNIKNKIWVQTLMNLPLALPALFVAGSLSNKGHYKSANTLILTGSFLNSTALNTGTLGLILWGAFSVAYKDGVMPSFFPKGFDTPLTAAFMTAFVVSVVIALVSLVIIGVNNKIYEDFNSRVNNCDKTADNMTWTTIPGTFINLAGKTLDKCCGSDQTV